MLAANHKNSDLPPIWVISLRRSTERRAHITQHLKEHNLPFEFFDAIDGQTLTPDQLACYDAQQACQCMGRELVPSEIAIALSHLTLYQRMVDQNLDEVLILEDDVVLKPEFLEILSRKSSFPKGWELVLLCHTWGILSAWYRQPIFRTTEVVRFSRSAVSSAAYLLRQSGARKLLVAGYPIRVPSDHLTGGKIKTNVNLYGISPACAETLHPCDPTQSTIPEAINLRFQNRARLAQMGRLAVAWHRWKLRFRRLYYQLNPLTIV
ncbi:MAG TPA: glycosyltransferase family 25 protein [Acidobacteriota bacterium]|nr:glycosyltransferase family 25 protein [Acidobacteriota bacterium]HNG94864.1 glycosyltransferase family 25 protein [Acidobacteriota bacterium]